MVATTASARFGWRWRVRGQVLALSRVNAQSGENVTMANAMANAMARVAMARVAMARAAMAHAASAVSAARGAARGVADAAGAAAVNAPMARGAAMDDLADLVALAGDAGPGVAGGRISRRERSRALSTI